MSAASDRFARALVRLYPPSWRERYGEEYLALLHEGALGPRAALDALAGAADAWTRPRAHLLPAPQRLRATVSVVWCAWIAAAAGALLFAQTTEDAPYRSFDSAHPLARWLYLACVMAGCASVLALLAGAAPLAWSLVRRARRKRDRRLLALLCTAIAAPLAFLASLVAISHLVHHSSTAGVGVGPGWFAVLVALGLGAGAAGAVGPAVALREVELEPAVLALPVLAGLVATATMILAGAASVAYEVVLARTDASFAASYAQPWALVAGYALLMALACGTAAVSTRRGVGALSGS